MSWVQQVFAVVLAAVLLSACGNAPVIPAAEQPLTKETLTLLGKKGMAPTSPIYVRIFKDESELEIWKARDDGYFHHFKTYPICHWSGDLGPKTKQGDKQAPEGFYTVNSRQLNPNSSFHLAFNLGYPNAFDRAHGRTGEFLMVHGKCKSAGCYAMTDALIEEIYGLARESLRGGQESFEVHAFPFRMTEANMAQQTASPWMPFWKVLKQGYDHFEVHRTPPGVAVCERRYVVNVINPLNRPVDAERACPRFERPQLAPFTPKPSELVIAEERIMARGPKLREIARLEAASQAITSPTAPTLAHAPVRYGLGAAPLAIDAANSSPVALGDRP